MHSFFDILVGYIVLPLSGMLLSGILTWGAIKVLPFFKLMDVPRGRHQHEKPIPLGGGIAVGIAFFAACVLLLYFFSLTDRGNFLQLKDLLRYFTIPGVIILLVGLLDDRYELPSFVKLGAQIIVGMILYFEGCGIERLFRHDLPAVIAFPVTVIWCVGIINAFNLIDGLDGLVSGLAAISSFLLACWTIISGGSMATAAVLLIFCGCCLGFLRFNFSPARIFMGDTGSMFLGLFFAYISMQYSTKSVTFTALMVPLAAIGVPVFDVFLAVWRRGWRKYISKEQNSNIMQGDHDHLHHRILKETGKTRKTALIIYGLSISLSLLAMASEFLHSSFPTLAFVVLLIAISAVIRFSNIELYDTLTSVARGISVPHRNFLFTAIHPVLDMGLIVLSLILSSSWYVKLIPFSWGAWWYLIFTLPFTLILCFSGIYRTFWVRAGILQYYKLVKLLIFSGITGFLLNGLIWLYAMDLSGEKIRLCTCYYLVFWLIACALILGERFLIHYYESFGYRKLFIRNQGKNSTLERVLIYGGGVFCRMYIASSYCSSGKSGNMYRIMGILDDNCAMKHLNVYGFNVLGSLEEIEQIYDETPFDRIVIACDILPGSEKYTVLESFCRSRKIKLSRFVCTLREE